MNVERRDAGLDQRAVSLVGTGGASQSKVANLVSRLPACADAGPRGKDLGGRNGLSGTASSTCPVR